MGRQLKFERMKQLSSKGIQDIAGAVVCNSKLLSQSDI
ncbi:hypothetical protein EMIT0P171_100175 [Pseudomonas sp. IT-P171]|jgi:hypothetical protein